MLPEEGKKEVQPLSRRDALKALAAATGVASLSNVPDKWQTPLVEVGLLPAHAQTSGVYSISNLSSTFIGINDCNIAGITGSTRNETFRYNDPSGNITASTIIDFAFNFIPSNFSGNASISLGGPWPAFVLNVAQVGDRFQGTIALTLCTQFATDIAIQDTISIINAAGNTSNSLTVTTNKPLGAVAVGGEPVP